MTHIIAPQSPERIPHAAPPAGTPPPQNGSAEEQPEEETDPAQRDGRQLVVFTLAKVSYGLDISAVESIIKMQPITVVPHAHSWVEGVTNLRGTVLPVINLRKRFGLPVETTNHETRIMVVNVKDEKVGIVVDAVSEVLRIPAGALEPPPPMVTADSAFIQSVARVDDRIVILLDFEKVLF